VNFIEPFQIQQVGFEITHAVLLDVDTLVEHGVGELLRECGAEKVLLAESFFLARADCGVY
jgi:hypothetical protein